MLTRATNWQRNTKRALRIINELFKKNFENFKSLMKTRSIEFEKHTNDLAEDFKNNLVHVVDLKSLFDE